MRAPAAVFIPEGLEMSDQKRNEPTPSLGDVWRDLCRQFRTSFQEGVANARAAREAQAAVTPAGDPAPGLSADERAKLHRLLNAWPGKGREDAQA